jgi:peptidoglycan/LPS O-acetylase OafA/YrhL
MNTTAQEETTDSKGDQVEYVEPDRRTEIKYLLWVAIIIATPYLVTIGLISIVGFVVSLWGAVGLDPSERTSRTNRAATRRIYIRWSFVCGFWHVAVSGFDGAGWVECRAGALSLTKMCGQD